MAIKLTKQEVMKEIVQCGRNPQYFINTYAKITHPLEGLIPFHLYDFQEKLLEDFQVVLQIFLQPTPLRCTVPTLYTKMKDLRRQ